jgi:hypothetical protein
VDRRKVGNLPRLDDVHRQRPLCHTRESSPGSVAATIAQLHALASTDAKNARVLSRVVTERNGNARKKFFG